MPQVPLSGGPRVALGVTPGANAITPGFNAPDVRLNAPTINTTSARTPQLDTPQLRPALRNPDAMRPIRLADKGAQLTGMGQALAGASDALGRAAMGMQTKINATVVDDTLNAAREEARRLTYGEPDGKGGLVGGYRNLKGWEALNRDSGKGLDDEVGEAFDNKVKELLKTRLSNADQRAAFEAQIGTMAAQLRQGTASHAAEEFDRYHTGVYKGMVENLTQSFSLAEPGDRAGQKEIMDQIEGAVATLGSHTGASAQELEVGMRGARGAAVASLFDRMLLEKKYDTAQALLNEWGGQIDANTSSKMKANLDGRVQIQTGEQLGAQAWRNQAAPAFEATDVDKTWNNMLRRESGNRQVSDDGKVVTSPKGAFGVAQLMPDTAEAVAKKLGRPELAELAKQPTKEGQAANLVLGRTHFNDLVAQFKGDTTKAAAAYNAGAGWLIGGKDTRGNPIEGALKIASRTGTDWRDHLPKETRDYIRVVGGDTAAGKGAPARPTRQAMYDAVDSRSDDPDVRKAAYAWIDRRYAAAESDERDGHEQAMAQAMTMVRENGGNINALPPELRRAVRPDQWDSVQTYAHNLGTGVYNVTKPEAYQVAMNPAALKVMTPAQLEALRPDLSAEDYGRVVKAYNDVKAPKPGKGPDSLDIGLVDGILNNRLKYLGVETAPKKGSPEEARLGGIRQFVHTYVTDTQRQQGAKITDYAAMEKVLNAMFLREEKFKQGLSIPGTPIQPKQSSVRVLTAKAFEIPDTTRNSLVDSYKAAHAGRKPSDAELLSLYYRRQFYEN